MRRRHDQYFTPEVATRFLLAQDCMPVPREGARPTVLEPCAGRGGMANVLEGRGFDVVSMDIDPAMEADYTCDSLLADWSGYDMLVTNPPFSRAAEYIHKALRVDRIPVVAMFMRLSILEPCEDRAELLSARPPNYVYVLPRISFTGDGKTDTVTCAWFVWCQPDIYQTLEVVTKERLARYA